jgi:hypothetical protein
VTGVTRGVQFLGRGLEIPDPRRVLAKHFGFYFGRKFRITVSLDQLIRNLELPERLNLPLWTSPYAGIGSPHYIIRAEVAEQGAKNMCTLKWTAGDSRREGRAQLGSKGSCETA